MGEVKNIGKKIKIKFISDSPNIHNIKIYSGLVSIKFVIPI
jgi:hypothetical protein